MDSELVFRSSTLAAVLEEPLSFVRSLKPQLASFSVHKFFGSGVYALFYTGPLDFYSSFRSHEDFWCPIYVGKAVPSGWRQGRGGDNQQSLSTELRSSLRKHFRSIEMAKNLQLTDFHFVAAIMKEPESDLIAATENILIREFRPLWNSVVDGFGNNDPGRGRYNQAMSDWDVLHPGRPYAEKCLGSPSCVDDIVQKIKSISPLSPF